MNEQLKRIYEAMADKTLSFGCRLEGINKIVLNVKQTQLRELMEIEFVEGGGYYIENINEGFSMIKIIGHPVMIGDVMNYIENNIKGCSDECEKCGEKLSYDNCEGEDGIHWYCGNEDCGMNGVRVSTEDIQAIAIMNLSSFGDNWWKDKTKSIDEQSQECIDFVHSLIPKE